MSYGAPVSPPFVPPVLVRYPCCTCLSAALAPPLYLAATHGAYLLTSLSLVPPVLVRYPLLYVSEYPKSSSDVLVGSPHSWSPMHQVGGPWVCYGEVLDPQPTRPTAVGGLTTLLISHAPGGRAAVSVLRRGT